MLHSIFKCIMTFCYDALNSVENENVLGVRIDNNLTWSIHINVIATKFIQIMANIQIQGLFIHRTQSNFTKHIFSPTFTFVLQYGEDHLNIV